MKYDKTYIFIFNTITTNVFVSIPCWYDGKWYKNQNLAEPANSFSYKVSIIMLQEQQNA